MAWKTHWQCCFQSMNGTQYAVNICEQDYDGDIVQLTGAEQPFTTQEDESEDIFTPIRSQSGYLRVIDPDGTLLADLIPQNNTERLVQLFHGTYTGTWPDGTFTHAADALDWQGFLQAQAYTQPWDGNANELELPVKSLLGALEDVTIDEEYAPVEKNVAALILAAFSQFGLRNTVDLRYIHVISDAADPVNTLLPILQWSVFFSEETINNEGDSYNQLVGMSYSEALSAVMSLYGWQMRENGSDVYLVQYDAIQPYHDGLRMQTISFPNLQSMAEGNRITREQKDIPSADMLTALTFRGADNVAGYVQGGKIARVSLTLGTLGDIIEMPFVLQDRSTIYEKNVQDDAILYVQAHQNRDNSIETYTYVKQNRYTFVEYTDYTEMLACSWITGYTYNPYYSASTPQVTGMFPCRFLLKKSAEDAPVLRDGLYFSCQYPYSGQGTATRRLCYSIKTERGISFRDGWLVLSLSILGTYLNRDNGKVVCNSATQMTEFLVALRVGSKFWNGSAWVEGTDPLNYLFKIEFKGDTIVSNKTIDMETDKSGGFFVPVNNISGDVEIYISNDTYSYFEGDRLHNLISSACIIESISVEYAARYDILASNRRENVYLKAISEAGFSEEKDTSLIVGTWNNNIDAINFITDDNGDYIEDFTYRTRYSTTKQQRPELHLLDRMVAQYNQVRRLFTAIAQRGLSLMDTRYTYQERAYFGVKKQTNWRDDTEEVKFIEIS